MIFLAPDVPGGATSVNKSGYSCTLVCGSTAAGEPIPPHFQLKTMAQIKENQRISIDWILNCKNVVGRFGYDARREHPCTFGLNEKGGMTSEELHKYITTAILPLYPDLEDKPGKRILIKVDSGPGRRNVDMLAELKLAGAYILPGVPNTTGKTQETDQNYGQYKSVFRDNLRVLSQARFEKNLTMKVTDLPLLVFGGTDSKTRTVLRDAFTESFGIEANISSWKKCGAVPLTRAALDAEGVRHEIPTGAAAAQLGDDEVHHKEQQLQSLQSMNKFFCNILTANGFDGDRLKKEAPKRKLFVSVTVPHSEERIIAIKNSKTSGQLFMATRGRHITTDEYFQADTLRNREIELKAMEDAKKERTAYCKVQREAVLMIREKGELTSLKDRKYTIPEIKILCKWKGIKLKSTKKEDLIEAYINTPKPKIQKVWSRSEEAALQALKNPKMELKETALGAAATRMARAVTNNLATLPSPERKALQRSLEEYNAGGDEAPQVQTGIL